MSGSEPVLSESRSKLEISGGWGEYDHAFGGWKAFRAFLYVRRRRVGVIGAVGLVVVVGIFVFDAVALMGGPRVLAQSTAAPQIVSGPLFSVEEGTVMVATLVATDSDTVVGDLEWSTGGRC